MTRSSAPFLSIPNGKASAGTKYKLLLVSMAPGSKPQPARVWGICKHPESAGTDTLPARRYIQTTFHQAPFWYITPAYPPQRYPPLRFSYSHYSLGSSSTTILKQSIT